MKAIAVVAGGVFRDSIRDRIAYGLVFFAVLLIAASVEKPMPNCLNSAVPANDVFVHGRLGCVVSTLKISVEVTSPSRLAAL